MTHRLKESKAQVIGQPRAKVRLPAPPKVSEICLTFRQKFYLAGAFCFFVIWVANMRIIGCSSRQSALKARADQTVGVVVCNRSLISFWNWTSSRA